MDLKNGKMNDVDKSTLVFGFSVLSLTLAQKTLKKVKKKLF